MRTDIKNSKILKLYQQGISCVNIAKIYGVQSSTIQRRLRKYIQLRSPTRRYILDHGAFSLPLNDEKAYWIGFIMADGVIYKNKYGFYALKCKLHARDKGHLIKLREFLKSNSPLYYERKKNAWELSVSSRQIARDLAYFGVIERKTFVAEVKNIKGKYERDFWRGMIDGDGCWSYDKWWGAWRVELKGNQKICGQFKDFILRNNMESRVKILKVNNKRSWRITFGGRYLAPKIATLLYKNSNISLDRKYQLIKNL